VGRSVWMDFPRLILPEPVPAGHRVGLLGAVPVMSARRQSNRIPRFLLTWAAATHCPTFLNPWQACCAGMPVIFSILPATVGLIFIGPVIVVPRMPLLLPSPCP